MAPLLQVRNLKKLYPPQRTVFERASLAVEAGEFVILCGPSGAGKSTLLNVVYLAEKPEAGEIVVDGQPAPWGQAGCYPEWRQKIGYIFQDQKLFPDRTIFENVALPFFFHAHQPAHLKQEVEKWLTDVGMFGQKEKLPKELSLGEKTLVALCRAMVAAPPLILADDPLSNLDPTRAEVALKLLEKEAQAGRAVVLTSATAAVPSSIAKLYFIERGGIVSDAPRVAV